MCDTNFSHPHHPHILDNKNNRASCDLQLPPLKHRANSQIRLSNIKMDNGGRYIDTRGIPFKQVPEEHKKEIQQYIADGKITPSEAGTSRTSSTLRTTEVDLSHLSENRRQKLAERMYQTRDEWDRSEFSASRSSSAV